MDNEKYIWEMLNLNSDFNYKDVDLMNGKNM